MTTSVIPAMAFKQHQAPNTCYNSRSNDLSEPAMMQEAITPTEDAARLHACAAARLHACAAAAAALQQSH